MSDINHVILIGRLTRNAELKYTSTGAAICNFSIAINERYKANGQNKDIVNYFDVVLWGKMGEALGQYLLKGKQVAVAGKLKQDRWQSDGGSRQKVKVVCNSLQLLGSKNQGQGSASKPASGVPANDFEDDIPF